MDYYQIHATIRIPYIDDMDCYMNDNLSECSYLISNPITFARIQEAFPYDGEYHFRILLKNAKKLNIFTEENEVWYDMNRIGVENEIIKHVLSCLYDNSIEIQVTLLDMKYLVEDNNNDILQNYLDESYSKLPSNRPSRYNIETKSKSSKKSLLHNIKSTMKKAQVVAQTTNITLKSVQEGATSIWNNFKTSLNISTTSTSLLSDVSENNLAQLSEDLATIFSDKINEHTLILKRTWEVLFQNDNYKRDDIKWKSAGFQNSDPISDLKASGILALRCLIYLGENYSKKAHEMLQKNQENIRTNYPFAIVGINITLFLAEILNLRDQRYLSAQAGYWEMFESHVSFFEIFCLIFFHIDKKWRITNAVRQDFGKIIGEAKSILVQVLSKSPKSLSDFKFISIDVGLLTD